ncbi:MAG: efflux RND transporter permease subunit [candidate division KSB1 bacterium]|nr:efflux RND transporter permease subunit [candidate division KSB1 bacterium]
MLDVKKPEPSHVFWLLVRRPVAVSMVYAAVALLGCVSLLRLPIDLLPDLSYPRLTVVTVYPGAAPTEVETSVTVPIEGALSTLSGLRHITSVSREEVSLVTLEFPWGTNMDVTMLHVREKLDELRWLLPRDVDRPTILRMDPRSQPIMGVAVSGAELGELTGLCRDVFKRRLEQLPGLALVELVGEVEPEIQVEVDQDRLETLGLSVADVAAALQRANVTLPGGTIRRGEFRFSLRLLGTFRDLAEIEEVPIFWRGERRVRVRDVASVRLGTRERENENRWNGRPSIGLLIYKDAGANTIQVCRAARAALSELRARYPDLDLDVAFDQSAFISQAIANVLQAVAIGGVLAFLVLFLFLRDPRYPLMVSVSIPLSILATFIFLHAAGAGLNLMTLGGLALGVGMLVDASVVVLENIFRHWERGEPPDRASVTGVSEVAMAVTASTLTTVAVFFPVVYVRGVAGQLFKHQAYAVSTALLASLVVSLTLLPVLAAGVHPSETARDEARSGVGPLRRLASHYERVLDLALRHPWRVVALTLLAFGLALLAAAHIERELMPWVDQGEFVVELEMPPGTSLEATSEAAAALERHFLAHPGVQTVFATVGIQPTQRLFRAGELALHRASFRVRLRPGYLGRTQAVMEELRRTCPRLGTEVTFQAPQAGLAGLLDPGRSDVEVQVFGEDWSVCRALAEALRQRLARIQGFTGLTVDAEEGQPEVRIAVRRDQAVLFGLSTGRVSEFVRDFFRGNVSTQFEEPDRKIDIRVWPKGDDRRTLWDLLEARIPTGYSSVPVREVVDYRFSRGPSEIRRENQERVVTLRASVAGRRLGAVLRDVQREVAAFRVPAGVRVEVTGARQEMRQSFRSLITAAILAVVLVFMILAAEFESLWQPFVVMMTVPLGVIGVAFGLLVTGTSWNVISLIGFVVLVGIVVNDGIVKVDFINRSVRRGTPVYEAIRQAGRHRLRPIVMTTVTTVLGLLPMAVGIGAGAELQRPLAVTVIFGISFATLLTLVVVPVLYLLLAQRRHRV